MDDAESKDQSTVNDDLELSDDEMDKDSGSSCSSNLEFQPEYSDGQVSRQQGQQQGLVRRLF